MPEASLMPELSLMPEVPALSEVLPMPEVPPKSGRGNWPILIFGLLVLGIALVILFRAIPHAVKSPSAAQTQPASREMPAADQGADFPEPAPSRLPGSNALKPAAAGARDPFMAPSTVAEPKTETSKPSQPAPKAPTPAAVIHIQPGSAPPMVNAPTTVAKPSANQPAAKQTSASQQSSATSNSKSTRPAQPVPTPSPKDSKVKSLLKKAGNVLKKPFDN